MSLHGNPVVEHADLPDGRKASIRVGIFEDPYVADKLVDTVTLEVSIGGELVAGMDTVLDGAQVEEARRLATRVRDGLASGELEPTVHSLEPLADSI